MRRALATLLITLFSLPLLALFAVPDAVSQLPACCRRNGKHHCSMSESAGSHQLRFTAHCSQYPQPGAPFAAPVLLALARQKRTLSIPFAVSAMAAYVGPALPLAQLDTASQRGPPSFLA